MDGSPTEELTRLLAEGRNAELVLDSMTEAVIAHDLERRITFFNRAAEKLTGLRREEVLGRDCHQVIQGGLCGKNCSFCESCAPEAAVSSYPLLLVDTAGREHRLEMTVVPMTDTQGRVVGALATARDVTELDELRRALGRERSFRGIVGRHPRMQAVYEIIRQAAPTDFSVLVQGESGTGKELVAAAIHAESHRSAGPFVPIHCSALPEDLLESELFGHVRGAFTGAVRDRRGRLELAHGGTVFLDEVGELSPRMQVKLLRVLQEKRFERVGSESTLSVDIRIVSASNRNLRQAVKEGRFREDLFYRLCVVQLELPPLRERRTDIPLLVDELLERLCREAQRPVPAFSDEARSALMGYAWPGNVRELINVLQHALVMSGASERIGVQHLPLEITSGISTGRSRLGRPKKLSLEKVKAALEQAKGNREQAARMLGIGRATLYRYLKKMEVTPEKHR